VVGRTLGKDPLAGLGTPGERAGERPPGGKKDPPKEARATGKSRPSGRAKGRREEKGPGDESLARRLEAIERRVDAALRTMREEGDDAGDRSGERERMVRVLRALDERVVELAGDTSKLARGRRRGLFRGARNIAKLAGELVTPDYYTRKLGEFGLRDRSSQVDEFGMDSVYRSSIRPVMEFLFRRWWRVRREGISRIPDRGPALLIGNHAGLVPYDAAMVAFGVEKRHPAKRRVRFLIEDWFATLPFANPMIARAGAVRGNRENAERLLRTGHLVGAFPEGTKGSLKYYRDRYRVQRFGRGGSVRLAMRTGVPIVPFAIVGSEEIYPVVAKANWLARIVGLEELPIAINVLLGPLGLVPLPSRWVIRFGEPIQMEKHGEKAAESDLQVNALTNQLRMKVQKMVDELLEKRGNVWLS
jgi:1-acyl-sn-glycerol-3-phosphate acyltransferase